MKAWKVLPVFSLALLWSVTTFAQDPTKVAAANYKVILENPSVRILKITYTPGAKSAPHSHPEAVVIPLVTSKVRFTGSDGKSQERELAAETAMFVPAETHSSENVGTGPVDAILVEFKSKAPGTATLPDTRAGLGMKHTGRQPAGRSCTARPQNRRFQEPAGSKHEFDQVVISLSARADVPGDRRQTGQDQVDARRRAVHPARCGARIEEHGHQAGRLRDRRDQVARWRDRSARPVSTGRAHRRRRDGRGLEGARRETGPHRRHQDAPCAAPSPMTHTMSASAGRR